MNKLNSFLKKFLAFALLTCMLAGSFPSTAFAEVEKAVWQTEDGGDLGIYWPSKSDNELRTPSEATGDQNYMQAPTLEYSGKYINEEGREVVRYIFQYRRQSGANSANPRTFNQLLFKIDNRKSINPRAEQAAESFYEIIDWDKSKIGLHSNNKALNRSNVRYNADQCQYWENFKLDESGYPGGKIMRSELNLVLGANVGFEIPLDFVLKEGKSVDDLAFDPFIMLRIQNPNNKTYRMPYTQDPYTASTFFAAIPRDVEKDDLRFKAIYNQRGLKNTISSNTRIEYKKDQVGGVYNGSSRPNSVHPKSDVVYVIQKQAKDNDIETLDTNYGGIAFRTSFDREFFDAIKPVIIDGQEVYGQAFITSGTEQMYGHKMHNITKSDFNMSDSKVFMQVNSNPPYFKSGELAPEDDFHYVTADGTRVSFGDSFLNKSMSSGNVGTTVIRWFVDRDKFRSVYDNTDPDKNKTLKIYTSFVKGANYPSEIFDYTADEDIVIPKGSKFEFELPITSPLVNGENYLELSIGEGVEKIYFVESISPVDSARKKFEFSFNQGMTIKKGTKISLTRYAFNNVTVDKDSIGDKSVNFSITNLGLPIKSNKLEFIRTTNLPRILRGSENYATANIFRTELAPKVDEIFVPQASADLSLTGKSLYREALIYMKIPSVDGKDSPYREFTAKDTPISSNPYDGFKFETVVSDKQLAKDAPVLFSNAINKDYARSKPEVIEQVQARVNFNLRNDKSVFLEKITPLNKEYRFDPETGEKNPAYIPTGFVSDNLRVSPDKPSVELQREALDGSEDSLVSYPNYLDHTDKTYDLSSDEGKKQFIKRLFPDPKYDPDLRKDGLIVKGWTTQPLEDDPEDLEEGKTASEKYKKLVDDGKIIKDQSDWARADAGENLVFTKDSPLDESIKPRKVFAVWGQGLKINLHSNNGENKIYSITVMPRNFKDGKAIIDIPAVPYWNGGTTVDDEILKQFIDSRPENGDPRHTFVGWAAKADEAGLKIGYNQNELASEADNKLDEDQIKNRMYNASTILEYNKDTGSFESTNILLPNNHELILEGTFEEWTSKPDIDLYAHYRPFFNIDVTNYYKDVEGEDTASPRYVPTSQDYKPDLSLGLLFSAAITDYDNPTVKRETSFNSFPEGVFAMDGIEGFKMQTVGEGEAANFIVPGYDRLGQRLAYVAVDANPADKEAYYNFDGSWGKLGISIYGQSETGPLDPAFPDANPKRRIPKLQMLTLADEDASTIDIFSGATVRQEKVRENASESKFDLTGYSINMYNVPRAVPKPIFETIYNGDKSFKLIANGISGGVTVDAVKIILPDQKVIYFESHVIEGEAGQNFKLKINENEGIEGAEPLFRDPKAEEDIGRLDYQNEDGNEYFVFTYTNEETFAKGQNIQAVYNKGGLVEGTAGDIGSTIVEALPVNAALDDLKQLANDKGNAEEGTDILISASIAKEPALGTEYTLVKENGEPVLDLDNNPVKYVSQPGDLENKIIKFNAFNSTANKLEHGDKIKVITSLPAFGDRVEDAQTDPIQLILEGPLASVEIDNDPFHRWMDLVVTMKSEDHVAVGSFNIALLFDDNTKKEINDIVSNEELSQTLKEIYLDDNIKSVTVTATDKFGNDNSIAVDYEEPKTTPIRLTKPRDRSRSISVKGEANAFVSITITRKGEKIVDQTIVLEDDKLTRFELPNNLRLQKGDSIELVSIIREGNVLEGKVIARSNPSKTRVR